MKVTFFKYGCDVSFSPVFWEFTGVNRSLENCSNGRGSFVGAFLENPVGELIWASSFVDFDVLQKFPNAFFSNIVGWDVFFDSPRNVWQRLVIFLGDD